MLLISTIHDPQAKLAKAAKTHIPFLRTIYEDMCFCVTEKTHPDTITALGEFAILNNAEGPANGRRCALNLGLSTDAQVFHYCDGDRILFWAMMHPNELKEVVEKFQHTKHFVILGRTRQAFRTHPLFQRITESIINLSSLSGIDYLSGSRIIPRSTAVKILDHSRNNNAAALDLEWPKIVGDFLYTRVDGLEYEHRIFNLEKPFRQEVRTRLENMILSIGAQW